MVQSISSPTVARASRRMGGILHTKATLFQHMTVCECRSLSDPQPAEHGLSALLPTSMESASSAVVPSASMPVT